MDVKKTRNTEKQNLIKEILSRTDRAMSVDDISEAMPIKVNRTTVYRILDRFVKKGEVHSITDKNGKAYFNLCTNCGESHKLHNHVHFECEVCNQITCQHELLDIPILDGFTIQEAQILVIGVCNKCNNK